ncbi:MAG: ABC transporter ATP-binding protein [Polyangiales bacterium]
MIRVEHVTKYYGATPAVRDLDFHIQEGECVGFLGLNGAGKSTTLRLLSCLLLPTSGRVTIRGIDAEEQPHEIRKFIGFLPDTPPLYQEMSVGQFLRFAGQLRQMSAADVEKRLPTVLDTCGLNEVANQDIATLSHGYRQRVGIAQAIIHGPDLLILDEPIQGLDPVQIVEMRAMIRGLRGDHTILLSTHILSEIEQTCDRILVLDRGRIAAQGTEAELAARLGGQRMVEAVVRGAEAEVEAALQKVSAVQAREMRAAGDGLVQLKVRSSDDLSEALARALVEAGLGLRSMRTLSTGLEQIFVNLTRGHDQSVASRDTPATGEAAGQAKPAAAPLADKATASPQDGQAQAATADASGADAGTDAAAASPSAPARAPSAPQDQEKDA